LYFCCCVFFFNLPENWDVVRHSLLEGAEAPVLEKPFQVVFIVLILESWGHYRFMEKKKKKKEMKERNEEMKKGKEK